MKSEISQSVLKKARDEAKKMLSENQLYQEFTLGNAVVAVTTTPDRIIGDAVFHIGDHKIYLGYPN